MQSDVISVSANDIAPALDLVERTVKYIGYPDAYGEQMRLLAEELIGSIRFILEDTEATLWVDTTEENMEIHLNLEGMLSDSTRDRLVELSKSRSNEPPKGLFARIGAFFSDAFMSDTAEYIPIFVDSGDASGGYYMPISLMTGYHAPADQEKPDEYKGIEANILRGMADDVLVSARSCHAELTVLKKLPTQPKR